MENYELLKSIGEGTYGSVLKARHKDSGQLVAIKRFKESDEDEQVRKTALREIRILKQLKHENIVHLAEVFRHKGRLYLVFEYVERTILEDVEKYPSGLPASYVKRAMYQLIKSIEYCHVHNVIHRDIKPENLLMSKNGVLKLCDFGFARTLAGNGARYTDYVSTRWYRSPELLVGDQSYSKPVDLWAIGCMLAEMTTGMPLFPGESDIDQLFTIMRTFGPLPSRMMSLVRENPLFVGVQIPEDIEVEALETKVPNMPNDAFDVLKRCLAYEPRERPSCAELLNHKYFDGFAEWFEPQLREALDKETFVMWKKQRKSRKDRRAGTKDDDHRRTRSRKRRSSPYFDDQALKELNRRDRSQRDVDPRERDLRDMRADRRDRTRSPPRHPNGRKEKEKENTGEGKEREGYQKSRHTSVVSLAGGVVGVGVSDEYSRDRKDRDRERRRELRSRDAHRERERERLETRESARERKTRERMSSRERDESKDRERLRSRDRKRSNRHAYDALPNLAPDTKATRMVAFPTLASDDGSEPPDPMRRPRTRDSFAQIPRIHSRGDSKGTFKNSLPHVPHGGGFDGGANSSGFSSFKPKLLSGHGLGMPSNLNTPYFKTNGLGVSKPPAHKPLPQFYGGGYSKPPSRGRLSVSSSGYEFKASSLGMRGLR